MQREITQEMAKDRLPRREADANKGSFGSVLVAAGSMAYRGAAALCTEGALRAGAGLVYLASVEPVVQMVLTRTPECCACGCRTAANGGIHPQDAGALRSWFDGKNTVLLAGPGLGESAAPVCNALLGKKAPWSAAVLDADALNALAAGKIKSPLPDQTAITPHPGEAARLLDCTVGEVQADREAAARRLAGVADTLSDIADTVNAVCTRQMPPKGENFDFVVEHIARTTCQTCTRRSRCWVRGYATAMDGLYHLKPILEGQGRVEVQDLPGQLSVCIHPADLCTAANHGYRLWRSRRQTRARASMLRTALTEQYSALAGALAQLAGKLGQAGLPDPRREAKVAQLFADLGLDALECSVTADLAGRLTASVTICRTHFTQDEVRGLTDEVSRICRRDMDTPEITHCRTVTMLTFGERPLFTVEFGAAAHAASGQPVSGDALDQFCDTGGRAQMLLCDGMGTGRAAAVDGQMAAKLTAQLLRAGFAAESAARLVNVALGLKGAEQEAGATLDLLTVDLYTGRAGLFKAGAAPSFLVRGGVPRMLDGASLPMGVLDSLVGRSTTFALDAGDWVVLVSDGALTDGSDWLMQQLQLCAKLGHTPKQAAETVADAAACRAGEKRDDITVAVLAMGKRA